MDRAFPAQKTCCEPEGGFPAAPTGSLGKDQTAGHQACRCNPGAPKAPSCQLYPDFNEIRPGPNEKAVLRLFARQQFVASSLALVPASFQ
jgi:hypothetical protein